MNLEITKDELDALQILVSDFVCDETADQTSEYWNTLREVYHKLNEVNPIEY